MNWVRVVESVGRRRPIPYSRFVPICCRFTGGKQAPFICTAGAEHLSQSHIWNAARMSDPC